MGFPERERRVLLSRPRLFKKVMKTLAVILGILVISVSLLVLYSMLVAAGDADTAAGRQEWQQDPNKNARGGAK